MAVTLNLCPRVALDGTWLQIFGILLRKLSTVPRPHRYSNTEVKIFCLPRGRCRVRVLILPICSTRKLLTEADDVGRQLANLAMLFEGDGVELAAKVGQVMQGWVAAQKRLNGTGIGREGVIADGQSITDLKVPNL